MDIEKKYFMWYDSGRGPTYGPHYYGDSEKIGKSLYHSIDDLLKIDVSESLKKRLVSAKPGTKIKVHYLHSAGNLMLKCLSPEEVERVMSLKILHDKVEKISKEMYTLNKKISTITDSLMKK